MCVRVSVLLMFVGIFILSIVHTLAEPSTRTTRTHVVEVPQEAVVEPVGEVVDESAPLIYDENGAPTSMMEMVVEEQLESAELVHEHDTTSMIIELKNELAAWSEALEAREQALIEAETRLLQREMDFNVREKRRYRIDSLKASLDMETETKAGTEVASEVGSEALAVNADGSAQPVQVAKAQEKVSDAEIGVVSVAPKAEESELADAFKGTNGKKHRVYGPHLPKKEDVGDVHVPDVTEKKTETPTQDSIAEAKLNAEMEKDIEAIADMNGNNGVVELTIGDASDDEVDELLEETVDPDELVDDSTILMDGVTATKKSSVNPTYEPDHSPHHVVSQPNSIGDTDHSGSYLSF